MSDCVVECRSGALNDFGELCQRPTQSIEVARSDVRQALQLAHDWFADHDWVRCHEAVDLSFSPVDAMSEEAIGYCIQGALLRANPEMTSPLFFAATRALNGYLANQKVIVARDIFEFNDDIAADIDQIRCLLRAVVASLCE